MTPQAVPVYAGIVVSDVVASTGWYRRVLSCAVDDEGDGWSCLLFPDGSTIELFAGDPTRAGETFPSYAGDHGPPVLPGYAVEDPDTVVADLPVARSLPDWYVVVAPDGLRVVLTARDRAPAIGLSGFRFASPDVASQHAFLGRLGSSDAVVWGERPSVVPLIAADRAQRVFDPDGTLLQLVPAADTLAAGT